MKNKSKKDLFFCKLYIYLFTKNLNKYIIRVLSGK